MPAEGGDQAVRGPEPVQPPVPVRDQGPGHRHGGVQEGRDAEHHAHPQADALGSGGSRGDY